MPDSAPVPDAAVPAAAGARASAPGVSVPGASGPGASGTGASGTGAPVPGVSVPGVSVPGPTVPGGREAPGDPRGALRADCAACAGLCCVAPAFARSSDFPVDKPARTACTNLRDDFRCGIHDRLRDTGYVGCTVFDCFGAGQQVVQVTFGGRDWRTEPELARPMFAAFDAMRLLHELRWYLAETLATPAAADLHGRARELLADTERIAGLPADALAAVDVAARRGQVNEVLVQVGERVRAASPGPRPDRRGADLVGARLRGADLRGANLRGALLLGADLRGVDLRGAEMIGADLRGADVSGADLAQALFLTRFQVHAAVGDAATRLPAVLDRPAHWTAPRGRDGGRRAARHRR
ncbi:hypothetical protein PSD17_34070 [Pseudonocardia sp. D17]|nr:hypothetical protein PSD17_34070 [Pseudonocardia sp. D17]